MRVRAINLEMSSPHDVSGLEALLDTGAVAAAEIVAILGKCEGNGGRNDFSRDLAMASLEHLLAPRLGLRAEEVQDRIPFSFSGGTEGVVTPHMLVITRSGTWRSQPGPKRLVAAVGQTRAFAPHEIGRMAQVEETARAVREVCGTLRLESLADVHLVQLKGAIPQASFEQAEQARREGRPLRSDMVHSRAASALGVGLALGEISAERLSDAAIGSDWGLYSSVASCSAKPGLVRTEFIVFGNSPFADGELIIGHGVLADLLDVAGIQQVAKSVGLNLTVPMSPEETARIAGVFAKSEADPRGTIRGRRHTMLTDDDISDTRYSRCVLSSVLAATLGETRVYVSTRAEHHGPLGGGPLALLVAAR